jgi:hypothetical protein
MEKAIRAGGNNRQRSCEVMNEEIEQSPFHIHDLTFLASLWIGFYRIIFFRMLSPNHLFSNSRATEGAGSMSHGAGEDYFVRSLLAFSLCIGQPYFSVKQKMEVLAIFKAWEASPAAHNRNLKRFKFLLIIQSIMIYLHVF